MTDKASEAPRVVAAAAYERPRKSYELVTDGREPRVDRLSIVLEVFEEMTAIERASALAYLAGAYGPEGAVEALIARELAS